jgi:uroporphyrinogen-III decarboxylase
MGLVKDHPLRTPEDVRNWSPPEVAPKRRFAGFAERIAEHKANDLFVFGGVGSFCFERMHYLYGMEDLFALMCQEPEIFRDFGDKLIAYNCEIIKVFGELGCDGVWGGDDWGTQDRLMISPQMWREYFKPWYARLFAAARERCMVSYMHSCGKNNDIIPDFIDIGLDIIEIHQPNVYGVDWLAEHAGGRLCISSTPDIQTTLCAGDPDAIVWETKNLKDKLGSFGGGLLYIQYGAPGALGVTEDKTDLYLQTAIEYGVYA